MAQFGIRNLDRFAEPIGPQTMAAYRRNQINENIEGSKHAFVTGNQTVLD